MSERRWTEATTLTNLAGLGGLVADRPTGLGRPGWGHSRIGRTAYPVSIPQLKSCNRTRLWRKGGRTGFFTEKIREDRRRKEGHISFFTGSMGSEPIKGYVPLVEAATPDRPKRRPPPVRSFLPFELERFLLCAAHALRLGGLNDSSSSEGARVYCLGASAPGPGDTTTEAFSSFPAPTGLGTGQARARFGASRGLRPPGYELTPPTEWDIRPCWGLGKRAWVHFVHYIHLLRTDFDLLDKCTNDPTPGRHVASIQPLPKRPAGWSAWWGTNGS